MVPDNASSCLLLVSSPSQSSIASLRECTPSFMTLPASFALLILSLHPPSYPSPFILSSHIRSSTLPTAPWLSYPHATFLSSCISLLFPIFCPCCSLPYFNNVLTYPLSTLSPLNLQYRSKAPPHCVRYQITIVTIRLQTFNTMGLDVRRCFHDHILFLFILSGPNSHDSDRYDRA
jgi:hypothetical protein